MSSRNRGNFLRLKKGKQVLFTTSSHHVVFIKKDYLFKNLVRFNIKNKLS